MNNGQKNCVRKIALTLFLLVLVVIASSVINKSLSPDWLSAHGETVTWSAFILVLIARAMGRKDAHTPTYEEKHEVLNRFGDDHPWMKTYLALSIVAIGIGLFGVATKRIDVGEIMDKLGLFGTVVVFGLWLLPVFLVKLKESYDEAGRGPL